jgi:hypothetical protein
MTLCVCWPRAVPAATPGGVQQAKNAMFQHFKGHCDVTRYAADYCALKGEHLFSSKNGSGGTAGKATKA